MIRFNCPNCGAEKRAEDSWEAKTAKCESCGHKLIIPARSEPPETKPTAGTGQDHSLETAVIIAVACFVVGVLGPPIVAELEPTTTRIADVLPSVNWIICGLLVLCLERLYCCARRLDNR